MGGPNSSGPSKLALCKHNHAFSSFLNPFLLLKYNLGPGPLRGYAYVFGLGDNLVRLINIPLSAIRFLKFSIQFKENMFQELCWFVCKFMKVHFQSCASRNNPLETAVKIWMKMKHIYFIEINDGVWNLRLFINFCTKVQVSVVI